MSFRCLDQFGLKTDWTHWGRAKERSCTGNRGDAVGLIKTKGRKQGKMKSSKEKETFNRIKKEYEEKGARADG